MTQSNDRPSDVTRSQGDRARSLDALHQVEQHAGAAGPNRPNEWRDDLLIALDDLLSSLHDQFTHSAAADGLLSRIALEAPHLEPAVNELRRRQSELMDGLDGLRNSLTDLTHPVDIASVRSKIGEMTAEIRELRAWETDIVYDAYAFDLGTGD